MTDTKNATRMVLLTEEQHATLKLLLAESLARSDGKIQDCLAQVFGARSIVPATRRTESAAALGERGGIEDDDYARSTEREEEARRSASKRDPGDAGARRSSGEGSGEAKEDRVVAAGRWWHRLGRRLRSRR